MFVLLGIRLEISSFVWFTIQCFLNSLPGLFIAPLTSMTDLMGERIVLPSYVDVSYFCFFIFVSSLKYVRKIIYLLLLT